ncbi:unnamed protein product, partial [Prorocentrum cordatum]
VARRLGSAHGGPIRGEGRPRAARPVGDWPGEASRWRAGPCARGIWDDPPPAHLLRPPAAAPSAGLAGGLQGLLTLQQAALAQETAVEVRVMDAAAVERGNQILFSFVGVAAVLVALTAFVVTRGQDERGDLL